MMDEVSPDILFGTCGSSCADTTDVSASGCSQVGIEIRIFTLVFRHLVLSSSSSVPRCHPVMSAYPRLASVLLLYLECLWLVSGPV